MRKYKVTKWEIQSVSVGYETIIEGDFKGDYAEVQDGVIEESEKLGRWDKIHDEVLENNVTEYNVLSGFVETPFEWTDELVAEFALVSAQGSYGLYSGCKSREQKIDRFKDLKTSEFVPECDRHPSSEKLGDDSHHALYGE